MLRKILLSLAALLALPMAAQASITLSGSGLSGVVNVQTFDVNAGTNVAAANQFAGLTFGAGLVTTNGFNFGSVIGGGAIANFNPCCASPAGFTFASDQSDVAFGFATNAGFNITFEAYDNGTLVDSAVLTPGGGAQYVVFSGNTLDEIRINSTNGNVTTGWILDNLQTRGASVPEPGSLALVGLAIMGGLAASRRRFNVR